MLLLLSVSNNNAQSDSSIHFNSFLICFQNINPNVVSPLSFLLERIACKGFFKLRLTVR